MKFTTTFSKERETKGAVRYMEVDDDGNQLKSDDGTLNSIYIRKAALKGESPDMLTVTVASVK